MAHLHFDMRGRRAGLISLLIIVRLLFGRRLALLTAVWLLLLHVAEPISAL